MSINSFKELREKARESYEYWEEWLEGYRELSELVDRLQDTLEEIHDECLKDEDEDALLERIRIKAVRAIRMGKGEEDIGCI